MNNGIEQNILKLSEVTNHLKLNVNGFNDQSFIKTTINHDRLEVSFIFFIFI